MRVVKVGIVRRRGPVPPMTEQFADWCKGLLEDSGSGLNADGSTRANCAAAHVTPSGRRAVSDRQD